MTTTFVINISYRNIEPEFGGEFLPPSVRRPIWYPKAFFNHTGEAIIGETLLLRRVCFIRKGEKSPHRPHARRRALQLRIVIYFYAF